MVSLRGKFPFGVVGGSVPHDGSGMTRAWQGGGLDGDVAVRTEAEHAFPESADSRKEDGKKDGPCDNRSLSKTPHTSDSFFNEIMSPINRSGSFRRMQFIGVRSHEHSGNCKLPRTGSATEIPSRGQPDRRRGTAAFRRKA
jgi:hypothetical protein